jgi:hypothetical protein
MKEATTAANAKVDVPNIKCRYLDQTISQIKQLIPGRKVISKSFFVLWRYSKTAFLEVPVESLRNFITSMFCTLNRFVAVGLWRLGGREAIRARERHPFTL